MLCKELKAAELLPGIYISTNDVTFHKTDGYVY